MTEAKKTFIYPAPFTKKGIQALTKKHGIKPDYDLYHALSLYQKVKHYSKGKHGLKVTFYEETKSIEKLSEKYKQFRD